jgi:hypothetical protein
MTEVKICDSSCDNHCNPYQCWAVLSEVTVITFVELQEMCIQSIASIHIF